MRWILLKDVQILRRSKLLVGLLIIYPIAIATLMGFALSGSPEKPRVAYLNQVPANRAEIRLGKEKINIRTYTEQLLGAIQKVPVQNRDQAVEKVKSGGMIIAASTAPERTFSRACARFCTLTSSIALNSWLV